MSTPLSPSSKLEGLEVYAPRRLATRLRQESSPAPLRETPPASVDDPSLAQDSHRRDATEDSMETAQARVDDAIRAAVDLAYGHRNRPPAQSATRTSLAPDVLPEPPIDTRRRSILSLTGRYASGIGFAALVAYGITVGPSFDLLHQSSRDESATEAVAVPAPEPSPPRLVVEDRQAFANQPLPLALSVEHAGKDASVLLAGLASGTRLSAGASIGDSGWKLKIPALKDLYLYAPANFVGVMNAGIDLLSRDERLIDRRGVRLEWLADKEASPALLARPELASAEVARTQPAQTLDPELVSALMKRGQSFLAAGDIEGARIAFGRLAEAGVADAAFAEATTYDYRYLAEHHVVGVRGDQAKARALYQKAAQLGSKEAGVMLAQMETK